MNESIVSKRVALFVTFLSSYLTPFMGSSVNIALPSIGAELSMSAVRLSWVTTSAVLAAAIFLVPFGKIADIYGRKKIYTWGVTVYAVSSLAAALAPSALFLIIARAFQGIGASMIFGTGMAILTSVFQPGERGRALGINLAATYLGLSSGPFIGGVLTQHFGWRAVFVASFLIGIAIVPFIFLKLRTEWADARGERFDMKGALLYMAGLLGIIYGFSLLPGLTGIMVLIAGIILTVVFFRMEEHIRNPVLAMSHFRHNTVFLFSNLAAFINYSATYAVTFLLSLYLQYIQGLAPQAAGLVMVTQPLVMTVFSPLTGRLSDRVEPRLVASAGMAVTAAGLVPFIFLGHHTPLPVIVLILAVIGTGFALFSSPNTNAIMSSVGPKHYGIASASLGTMRLTGQAISMGIAMLVFAVFIGKMSITPNTYPLFLKSVRIAFFIFAVLCSVGVFASLARGKLRPD
jgi:MFS family permease